MSSLTVQLDPQTSQAVALAAKVAGLSPAQVVAIAIESYVSGTGSGDSTDSQGSDAVPIYCVYLGFRVEGLFDRHSNEVIITSGRLENQRYPSPSAAAASVVETFNTDRKNVHVNGWRFWKVAATRRILDTLR